MALRKTISLFYKTSLTRSEIIFNNSGQPLDSTTFVNKYKSILSSKNFSIANQMLQFPLNTFNKFPSTILQKLIKDSFNIVMEKGASDKDHINTYNMLLTNYINNGFNCRVNEVLKEMNQNKIKFNTITYLILLRNFCITGEMSAAEYLLEQIKSRNIKVNDDNLNRVVTGYIMTGQTDKAESIIAEHKIEESPNLIIAQAKGYASKGDVNNVMECIRKIDNMELKLFSKGIFNIYARLIQSKVPRSNLDELLQVMEEVGDQKSLSIAVFYLNRLGLYRDSLHLLEMFPRFIKDNFDDIITSFNSHECPLETYKQVLRILLEYHVSIDNIFVYMDFDKAFMFAESLINSKNARVICHSLLRKAIYDKSISEVLEALKLCRTNLKRLFFNVVLLFNLIPSMLESGMVSNCEQLIQLLPQFKKSLLAASLMHCLMKGKYSEYSTLKTEYKPKGFFFDCNYNLIAQEVVDNLSSTEIDRFAVELCEIYHAAVFDKIMRRIILIKLNLAAKIGNEDEMKRAVSIAETYQLMFSNDSIESVIKQHPDRAELLKSLLEKYVLTSDIDNSSANVIVEPTESTENQSETVS